VSRRARLALAVAFVLASLAAIAVIPTSRRRTHLLLLRATGKLSEMSWGEVLRLMAPRTDDTIELLIDSRNPFESIKNPFDQPADVTAGAASFRGRCARCHGGDDHGAIGPDLSQRERYRHGASDWAVFRTITRGVPGTAMPAHSLTRQEVWQLVAYVRQQSASRRPGEDTPHRPDIASLEVTFDRLRNARQDSANWLTYSGTLDGHRHSRLSQIQRNNVSRLKVKWLYQLSTSERVESTPLVNGTALYVTAPTGSVLALDTRTGAQLWTYSRQLPNDLVTCCGAVNRGAAILGSTLYVGTLDAHLVALDAATGTVKWIVEVADYRSGYSITGAPLAVDGKVIVGIAGGEFGIRGFLDAYDAGTGQRVWRFRTIPEPGEPGHETWGGDAWKTGGAPAWMTGSYDAASKVLYWAVGNPSPDYQGDVRPGDNLYSNCVLALDVDTGRLRWYYQFTPHDEHDWDATEILVLADADFGGTPRKLLLQANRNGFYYVLDRETGAFLTARAFVPQTWNDGFDSVGRPAVRPRSGPSRQGTLIFPGAAATNWWSPSFDPVAGSFFVVAKEQGVIFYNSREPAFRRGRVFMGSGVQPAVSEPLLVAVRALDATTGALRWEYRASAMERRVVTGGLLSTAGGIVFGGIESRFFALDARTGAELWWMNTGGQIHSAPITYLSEGRQQVTLASGQNIITFGYETP